MSETLSISPRPADWCRQLSVRPIRNRAAKAEKAGGGLRLTVRKRKPRYLVPPLSWIFHPRLESTLQLDRMGTEILELCDGERTAEEIVERVATRYQLTFHEARVSVTTYLRILIERGALALVLPKEEDA